MQRIIDFVVKYRDYITLTALAVISLSLISLGDTNKIGGFRTIIIGTVGWIQNLFSWIPNPVALESENRALRELNLELSSEVIRMRQALLENHNLRELLELKKRQAQDYIFADVVGKSSIEMRNYIIIDKGRKQGIETGMSARTDAGLVGVVIGVDNNFSLIESIMNPNVKVSAKIQRNGYNGVVVWEGGEEFLMKNMPKSFDVKSNDLVVTTSFSSKYPADVPIGTVTDVRQEAGELFLKVKVKPFVNFSTLEQLAILKFIPNKEIHQLVQEVEETIKKRKAPPTKNEKLKIFDTKQKKSP